MPVPCQSFRLRRCKRHCTASATLELIIAGPVILIVLLAVVQFGIAMVVQSALTHAVAVATREAARGAAPATVAATADRILGIHHLALSSTPGSGSALVLEDGVAPPVTFGDPLLPCNPPAAPAVLPHEVRVTISTQMTAGPLRNLLATFGVDFSARRFEISSLAQRE